MRAWNGTGTGLVGSAAIALLLAGCTAAPDVASTRASANEPGRRPAPSLPAGAPLPTGASIASMSEQYAHPRPGPVPAAGASAWVPPAPAPAFVSVTAPPPSDPPEPPLAAVANRQPGTPAPAAPPPRSAAAPQPAPAVGVDLAKGRQLFGQYACAGCHILADAGGAGGIGPSLDNNPRLTRDFVIGAVSEGRGAMPAYRDQMSAEEIAALADYIVEVSRK